MEEYLRKPTKALCQLGDLFTRSKETGLSVMLGPSGCSKTRTAYEVLSMKIGFYFTSEIGKYSFYIVRLIYI